MLNLDELSMLINEYDSYPVDAEAQTRCGNYQVDREALVLKLRGMVEALLNRGVKTGGWKR